MRTLLIHPPLRVHRDYIDYPAFTSLALWQNAAHLAARGFEAACLDAFSLPDADVRPPGADGYFEMGAAPDAFYSALEQAAYDVAVIQLDPFAAQDPEARTTFETIRRLRAHKPHAPVILADMHIGGMNYVGYDPARFLRAEEAPDALVRYEAEEALVALLERIANGQPPQSGTLIDGAPLPAPLSATDANPYAHVDIGAYLRFLGRVRRNDRRPNPFLADSSTLPFKSSRGCGFSCRFCTSRPAHGQGGWRGMDADAMRDQIAGLGVDRRVGKLWCLDEVANFSASHFDALLDAAEAAGLGLEFPNGLRADRLSERQIERLAGRISLLSLSPESGSSHVLETIIDKRQSLSDVERVCAQAATYSLPVALHFMVGLPGERRNDTLATVRFAERMLERYHAEPWLQFAVAVPGTPLFEDAKQKGLLPDPLPIDYNPLFQGRPMLKDGAAELANEVLVRLVRALNEKAARTLGKP